jgi:hypothetical protein
MVRHCGIQGTSKAKGHMPSVYKDKKSPYYQTDIWIDGNKFSRSTRKTSRREAEAEADRLEQKLRDDLKVETIAETSLRIDEVALRYMKDVGDHHAGEGASITEARSLGSSNISGKRSL